MLAIERKNEILETLQKEQSVLVADLSQKYDVTEETIRRDLEKLEKEGYVKKTYGGAVLNTNRIIDLPLRIREKRNRKEKTVIATKVAELIEEGDSVMLDSSSTSLIIAQQLKKHKNLTVITNSVEVLIELSGNEGIKVISTGGILRDASLSLVGKSAREVLNRYNVDKAVISCKGVDIDKGVTDSNDREADVKRGMCSRAKMVILAADNSKIGGVFFVKVTDMERGNILVTDKKLSSEYNEYFEQIGVQVITGED